MDILFEQRVIQNTGLAAEAIWQATLEAYETKGRVEGIALPLAFVVLPVVFHHRSATALAGKTQPGALYKALAENREMTLGLQSRMQALADRTFHALSIGFHTGLLEFDAEQHQLVPRRKTLPVTHVTQEVKDIMSAAKRIGQAFAEMNLVELSTHLHIRF